MLNSSGRAAWVGGVAGLAAAVLGACPAGASVTFGPVSREVTARAGFGAPESRAFAGPGAWSEAVYREWTDEFHLPGQPSWGRAAQVSSAGHDGAMGYVRGTGSQAGYDGFPVGGMGTGTGESVISAAFTLDAPSQADLFVNVIPGGTGATSFYARVKTAGGDVIFGRSWAAGDFGARWGGAVLPAGSYTFEAFFRDGWTGAGVGGGSGTWSLALTIPGPGAFAVLPVLAAAGARRRR